MAFVAVPEQSSRFARLGQKCYNAFRRGSSKSPEEVHIRSTIASEAVFPSMISDIDVVHANLMSEDAVKNGSFTPSISPRSTDAGCSTPSTRSHADSGTSDTASTDGGSSESEADSTPVVKYEPMTVIRPACSQSLDKSSVKCAATLPVAHQHKSKDSFKLQASPTSWAAQQKKRKGSSPQGADVAEVERNVRSVLNKLTLERFDSLYEKVVCTVRNSSHIAILVREIFEKAIMQHTFICMYADLCVRLESDVRIGEAVGMTNNNFRRILLGQCQWSFEELLASDGVDGARPGQDQDDVEEARLNRKRRAIGNVKLVGQLLVRGMLSSKLLVACSEQLLMERKSCPEALESLACLLTVAGPKFDTLSGWVLHARLEGVFEQICALSAAADVTPRIRCLLRDLLELRGAGWTDNKCATKAISGPMKLEEVREDTVVPEKSQWRPEVRPQQSDKKVRKLSVQQQHAETNQAMLQAATSMQSRKSKRSRGQQAKHGEKTTLAISQAPVQTVSLDLAVESLLRSIPVPDVEAPCQETPPLAVANAVVEVDAPLPVQLAPFDKAVFRRELVATLKELASSHDVAAAVRRIRAQNVPLSFQATEFADMLVRAAEETRGPARRYAFAFIAGLGNGEHSAFDKVECINGITSFFLEDFEGLSEEVPKLASLLSSELVPTLRSVFPPALLEGVFPKCVSAR